MAWTVPATYVSGAVATAAGMNTYVKDNLAYLKSLLDGTGTGLSVIVPHSLAIANDPNFNLQLTGGAGYLYFDAGDNFAFDRAGNVFYWIVGNVAKMTLDANGKLAGAGFYTSGEVGLANGGGTTLTHGLGARPRFVAGFYSASSGTEDSKTTPMRQDGTLSGVYIGSVTSTGIVIGNVSGAGVATHVYAMR